MVEIVEVFKALHVTGFFGDITFKNLMIFVGVMLGIKLGQYNVPLIQISPRKKNQTPYLDKMRQMLVQYLDGKL